MEFIVIEVWCDRGRITVDSINVAVVGDFNSHNPLWGSTVKDNNGMVMENYRENYGLIIINDEGPTRF